MNKIIFILLLIFLTFGCTKENKRLDFNKCNIHCYVVYDTIYDTDPIYQEIVDKVNKINRLRREKREK